MPVTFLLRQTNSMMRLYRMKTMTTIRKRALTTRTGCQNDMLDVGQTNNDHTLIKLVVWAVLLDMWAITMQPLSTHLPVSFVFIPPRAQGWGLARAPPGAGSHRAAMRPCLISKNLMFLIKCFRAERHPRWTLLRLLRFGKTFWS